MKEDIFNRLQTFVIKESFVDDEEITRETKLEDDLGIKGNDAVEFLLAYSKEFNVDLSRFMAKDYFSPEGDVILPALIRLFTGKPKLNRKQLTVGHLERGIMEGRLDENIINDSLAQE